MAEEIRMAPLASTVLGSGLQHPLAETDPDVDAAIAAELKRRPGMDEESLRARVAKLAEKHPFYPEGV
jgi:hypothetical protein